MNVQHCFATVSDGMFAIMSRLGLGPEEIRRRQMSFVLLDLGKRQATSIPDDIRAAAAELIAAGTGS
jgi:hypothetical protein